MSWKVKSLAPKMIWCTQPCGWLVVLSFFLYSVRCSTRGLSLKTIWYRTWWPNWTIWSAWVLVLPPPSLWNLVKSVSIMVKSWNSTARPTRGLSVLSAGNLDHTGWVFCLFVFYDWLYKYHTAALCPEKILLMTDISSTLDSMNQIFRNNKGAM